MAASGKLCIIWSSADPEVARSMVFMYAQNSRLQGWWDRVILVVWGPSARLLAENKGLQADLEDLKAAGVELQACKACAAMHGVVDELADLGIEVIYMGAPLTEMLKTSWHVLTF